MPIEVILGSGNKLFYRAVVSNDELALLVNEAVEGDALAVYCSNDEHRGTVHRLAVHGQPPELVEVLGADTIEPGKPYVHPDKFGYLGAIGKLSLNFIRPELN